MLQSRMDKSVAHKFLKRFKKKAKETGQRTKKSTNNILQPVRSRVRSARIKRRRKTNRLKAWLSSEGARYLAYLKPYGAYVFVYGFLLNYTLHILLSFPLTYYTIPAWGIAYYFVKEELTEFILTVRGMNR